MERVLWLIAPTRSVQEADPIHREGDNREILFHLAFQEIGAHLTQHVAEAVVGFRKEDGLVKAGGVFKGDELHGIALPGMHRLSRDHPSCHGDTPAHMPVKIFGRHMVKAPQEVPVPVEGMNGEEEAKGFDLVL